MGWLLGVFHDLPVHFLIFPDFSNPTFGQPDVENHKHDRYKDTIPKPTDVVTVPNLTCQDLARLGFTRLNRYSTNYYTLMV